MKRLETPSSEVWPLSRDYPLSLRAILYRAFGWISWSVVCAAAMVYLRLNLPDFFSAAGSFKVVERASRLILQAALISVVLKLCYEALFISNHDYKIDRGSLIVRRGVLNKTTTSLPLSKVTDVCLQRNGLQLIFGVWNLTIRTPGGTAANSRIEGLSARSAFGLHDCLIAIIKGRSQTEAAAAEEHRVMR